MECPFCHREMEEGTIPGLRNGLFWKPNDARSYEFDRQVQLTKDVTLSAQSLTAFYCPDCGNLILPAASRQIAKEPSASQLPSRRKKDPWEV